MMNTCVPYQQKRGITLPSINELSTYVPCMGDGSVQQLIMSVTPEAAAGKYCDTKNCKDQIQFNFTIGCGIPGDPGDQILFNYDGTTGVDLAKSIIKTINMSPTLNAQGVWSVDGTNITYMGLFPGVNVNLETMFDPAHFDVVILSEIKAGNAKAAHLEHGTVAHTPALKLGTCDTTNDGRPCATAPTEDPAATGAKQHYAGIVVDRPYGSRGSANGQYPYYGDCNDCCPPVDPCVELVCGCCVEIDLHIEDWGTGEVPSQLFYRIAPSGKFTKLGRVAIAAGTGLIPLPRKVTPITRNGQYLVAKIH